MKVDKNCKVWFEENKVVPFTEKCVEKCISTYTGANTFLCPSQCEIWCSGSNNAKHQEIQQIAYYLGFTNEEMALVVKDPSRAIIVYQKKNLAENSLKKYFRVDRTNTESDAYRHFVWAALLTDAFGEKIAQEYLDAHEAAQDSSSPEKAMDLANGRAGVLATSSLKKTAQLKIETVEAVALSALKNKELIVLHPGNLPK